jgi:hypothetical protein
MVRHTPADDEATEGLIGAEMLSSEHEFDQASDQRG